jgi:hypothetical protein
VPNNDNDGSIGLEEVAERFEESTLALSKTKAQLDELAALQETKISAAASIEEASNRLSMLTVAATDMVESLSLAQQAATKAFSSIEQVVDGTELRQVREKVDAVATSLDASAKMLNERLDNLAADVVKSAALETELAAVKDEYSRLRGAAGARGLKKAGLG